MPTAINNYAINCVACYASQITDWPMFIVTLLTGAAVAYLGFKSYQISKKSHEASIRANEMADSVREQAEQFNQRRARTFGSMIQVEVGGAQSALYNIRAGLEREIDGTRIPDMDYIRRSHEHLKLQFLPHVTQSMGNVDALPETVAAPLLRGMADIETIRRSMTVLLTTPINVTAENILTPDGMNNVGRVCNLLRSAERDFRDAHRALWAFNFPNQPLSEWRYPPGADPA